MFHVFSQIQIGKSLHVLKVMVMMYSWKAVTSSGVKSVINGNLSFKKGYVFFYHIIYHQSNIDLQRFITFAREKTGLSNKEMCDVSLVWKNQHCINSDQRTRLTTCVNTPKTFVCYRWGK